MKINLETSLRIITLYSDFICKAMRAMLMVTDLLDLERLINALNIRNILEFLHENQTEEIHYLSLIRVKLVNLLIQLLDGHEKDGQKIHLL